MTDTHDEQPAGGFGRLDDNWATVLPQSGLDARDLLRAVVGMSPLAMVLTDPHQPDFPVVFCNRAFCRLTGYSEEETLGRNCRFLQGPDSDPAAIRVLADAVAAQQEVQVDLWNYRKDGSLFWNTMFVGPVFDRDGTLLYYFGSQIDATARREIDEARARAQRMDTLGSMAAGIAHEVNNLMTVIVGNGERLASRIADPKQMANIARVNWAAHETAKLMQQMLSFAGRQALNVDVVDLNHVLGGLDRLLMQVAASKIMVEISVHKEALLARVDVSQLELALINLVKNASDASPDGTRIVVTTSAREEGGVGIAEVSVIDQGSGMPPEVAAKATEPFFTTKALGKGTGLGLSIVAGFCQQSGGRMLIETKEGEGTTIRLVFPQVILEGSEVGREQWLNTRPHGDARSVICIHDLEIQAKI